MKYKGYKPNSKKMKIEAIKPINKIRPIFTWIGQQNVFLILFVVFLIALGFHKTFGMVSAALGQDTQAKGSKVIIDGQKKIQETQQGSVVIWDEGRTTPSPSPLPSPRPSPLPSPVLTPSPSPTADPDPIIACTLTALCGGNTIQMRRSECRNSVCCPVEPNKYESLSEQECIKRQSDYNKKQDQEYEKRQKEYEDAIKLYQESISQYNEDAEKRSAEYEQQETQRKLSYDSCVSSARQKAMMTCSINNTCDSRGYGSPDWIAQQGIDKCKQIYGF